MSDQLLRVGLDCYTYYSAGTTYEAPVWTLVDTIKDESLNPSKTRAEFMSRASKMKRKKGAGIEAPASLQVEYRKGSALIAALWDSFINDTVLDMAFMFDPIADSGSEGIRMPVIVFEMPFTRNLEDGVMIDIEVELTEFVDVAGDLVDLEWITVT